jgi:glutathione S-transferase
MDMKLYYHPVSTTSRSILMFAADSGAPLDYQVVDLFTGEHMKDEYAKINPNRLVPVLEDGDFRLTESSAILKYLADKVNSPSYPKDLQKRARVNERMDWLNSNLYKDFGYGLIYPQIFPHHKRPGEDLQTGTLAWGKDRTKSWLTILDKNMIGNSAYLCGDQITIADYFGAPMLTLGEVIGCNYAPYRNVTRWLNNMKGLRNWKKVNETFYGLVESVKATPFQAL